MVTTSIAVLAPLTLAMMAMITAPIAVTARNSDRNESVITAVFIRPYANQKTNQNETPPRIMLTIAVIRAAIDNPLPPRFFTAVFWGVTYDSFCIVVLL